MFPFFSIFGLKSDFGNTVRPGNDRASGERTMNGTGEGVARFSNIALSIIIHPNHNLKRSTLDHTNNKFVV